MTSEILIAGFGGQGIMLMGRLLAYGAIYEGFEVTFYPSYGPEMRGGTANCTVVISKEPIGSPIRRTYHFLMAMNQSSLNRFEEALKPGGILAYNQTLITSPPTRTDIVVVKVPANRIADELGAPLAANMVAIGAMARLLKIVSLDAVIIGLSRVFPADNQNLLKINAKAVRLGFERLA